MFAGTGLATISLIVSSVTLAAMLALVAFTLLGGFAGDRTRPAAQLLAQGSLATVLLIMVILFGATLAHAGMGGYSSTGYRQLTLDPLGDTEFEIQRLSRSRALEIPEHGCAPETGGACALDFERAAQLRDEIAEIKRLLPEARWA